MVRNKSKFTKKKVKKNRFSLKRMVLIYFSLFVFLVVLTAYISRYDSLQVTGIVIEGTRFVDNKEVEEKISSKLEGGYFGIFSKRNKYLVDEQNILNDISGITAVAKADLKIKDQKIDVSIVEHKPVALWCNENSTSTPCYFINEYGVAFAKEPLVYDEEVFLIYKDFDNPDLSKSYTNQEAFEKIVKLSNLFKQKGITMDFIKRLGDENYLFKQKDGLVVYFNTKDDAEYVFNNLEIVKHQIKDASIMESDVEYIDVRFGNRIYYKLK